MKRKKIFLVGFCIFVIVLFVIVQRNGLSWWRVAKNKIAQLKESPEKEKVESLINNLQDESNEGIGTHSLAWASGFMALDEEPRFHGGVMGAPRPVTSPTMRKLVSLGVAAIPSLLEHLTDARPTKLVMGEAAFPHIKYHSDEYHSRFHDFGRQPANVNIENKALSQSDRRNVSFYRVRVGDLCFVALGQIVNRDLNLTRYQPSCCLVINSPVETPALAAAARQEWAGLTAEEHEKSLLQDVREDKPYLIADAIVRLCFYYPGTGEAQAVSILMAPGLGKSLPFLNNVKSPLPILGIRDQAELIERLSSIRSDKIDQAVSWAVHHVLEENTEDKIAIDDLVLACSPRLKERQSVEKVKDYLLRRIREIQAISKSSPERYRLRLLQDELARIS